MQYRKLGNTDMTISAVGYGCMGLSHAFGYAMPEEDAIQRLKLAYELGYTFFDTAECYKGTFEDGSPANNEITVGRGIKGFRDKIVLASKFGVDFGNNDFILDSSPKHIRESIDGTLKRLGTDYLDLYYQHRVDPKTEPEVVAETMKELIKEGKIRAWGISAANEMMSFAEAEDYIRRAHAVCPVSAVENIYSMIDRATEADFGYLEELGITLVAYTPLAKGFLTGAFTEKPTFDNPEDGRGGRIQFSEEGFNTYKAALDLIKSKAEEKGATAAQISLAWMMCKKPWICPIPGTRTPSRMKENADASEIYLSAAEVAELDAALNKLNLADTSAQWRK